MANRIQKAWDDIIRWKKFFENLVSRGQISPDSLSGRSFKKEMLGRYNELLSRRYKNLSPEERSLRKIINRERRQLERKLYPNVFVRMARNLVRLTAATVSLPFRVTRYPGMANRAQRVIGEDLGKHGFNDLSEEIAGKVRQGERDIREKISESPAPKEIIDYDLSISGRPGKQVFEGFSATLTNIDGKEKRSLSIDDSRGLTKEQAGGLLHGRPVHTGDDKWKIPDINDADASGNIRIREIRIPDFDPGGYLAGIDGLSLTENKLLDLVAGLRNGKRMELPIEVGGKSKNIQVEAAPLQRSLVFYQDNKRTGLQQILGKETKGNTLKMDMPRPKVSRAHKM